jgi:RNA polymerase sigma factor (sigma-70 family)
MAEKPFWERLRLFFDAEYHRLVLFVRGLIDDAADRDAEDIVQEVAYRLFEKGDSGPIEHLAAYVYQALRNRVVDTFRRRHPDASLDDPLSGDEELHLADIIPDQANDLQVSVERNDLYRKVVEIIGELPDHEQALIIATEIEGMSFAQLAEEWEVPIGTLLSRKSRIVKKIRNELTSRMSIEYQQRSTV